MTSNKKNHSPEEMTLMLTLEGTNVGAPKASIPRSQK